jgi:hypothetical protein
VIIRGFVDGRRDVVVSKALADYLIYVRSKSSSLSLFVVVSSFVVVIWSYC